jgi:hypothetical protein
MKKKKKPKESYGAAASRDEGEEAKMTQPGERDA